MMSNERGYGPRKHYVFVGSTQDLINNGFVLKRDTVNMYDRLYGRKGDAIEIYMGRKTGHPFIRTYQGDYLDPIHIQDLIDIGLAIEYV